MPERWVENPYWQYFCGFDTMQHQVPLHSTSLTKWRQRVGAEKLAELLEETVACRMRSVFGCGAGWPEENGPTNRN